MIIIRFDLARSSDFILQYFDEDWQSYIDVEDIGCLVDKTKLRVTSVAAVNVKSVASPESVEDQDVLSKQSSTVSNVAQWPIQFVFPVQKVPANLVAALDKGIDLCNPKQRYLRGQLLQVLCSEAVNLTSHPDHSQKIEMAKSIITAWPHLKEPIGRGYDGWLASIVDCLKSTRRVLGLIDKSRSVAILKRKRALSSGPNVSTEQKDSGQDDSEATSVSSCTEDLPSSKSARIIPRYSKKSTEVLQSSQQQHSVENTDVEAENCTNHSEDIGVFQVFGSQITTVAVIECTPSTCNDEQMSESTSTPLTPVESVSTAVYSGKVQSALQSEHSESEDNSTGNVEEVCTLQDPQALMKDLWSKPEHERPWEKLLHLLKLTFDSRRMLLLRSSTTAHIHNEYPALFSREAIIQEYCLVAETSVCMTKAVENITQKCQMLVKLSAQKLQSDAGIAGRRAGVNRLSQIMSQLSLAMEHESDPDDEHQLRAVAGLLLLPLLLKDNSSYFITTLEVTYLLVHQIYVF